MDTQDQIINLTRQRENLQDNVNTRKDEIRKIQDEIDKYNEDIEEIDKRISRLKVQSAEKYKNIKNEPVEEEADAAITTGALDASSQSSGGDYGGWRYYSRIGDTEKRPKMKKVKKKKNIYNYMEHVWDNSIDGE